MVECFTEYKSFWEAGEDMTDEEYGQYMRVIHEFAYLDKEPDYSNLSPLVKAALRTAIAIVRKNKEDRENGKKGGRPSKTKTVIEQPAVEVEKEKKEPAVKGERLETEPTDVPVKDRKPTKPALIDRVPANDIERVEKAYLENYNTLQKKGVVKTEKPVINWQQSRKLTKDALDKYGLDTVLDAVRKSIDNDFCVQKGYVLTTILSSGVFAGLVNGNDWKHNQRAIDSVDKVTDEEYAQILF